MVLFFIVVRIAEAVNEALLPTLKDMSSDLNSIRDTVDLLNETIRCVNETAKIMAGDFEEHKDELADTQASIQSIIDNPPTDEISRRVLQLLLPYLNNIEEEIKTDIGQLISETATSTEIILRDELMEYKKQTTSELADLQSSINTNLSCVKTDLADLQSSINANFSCVKTDLADLQSSINANLSCVKTDLANLQSSINANLSCVKTDLADLQSSVNSVNNKLELMNKLFSDDFNDVKTELNGINDTTNEIVDEIEDHDKQTGTKLIDIKSLICDSHGCHTCGGTGGWRRVVYLNMTDPNTDCPSGWNMTNYNIRTCGRASDGTYSCDSVFFPVSGGEYSQVCGKMKAYQWGVTAGFYGYYWGYSTMSDSYFSGVAVLHGSPRQHIWSFIAGAVEHHTSHTKDICPCDTSYNNIISIPSFVGDDYFCESGYIWPGTHDLYSFHSEDPLWDGDGCHSSSTCCTFINPPYFTKYLDNPTTDDIELRLCCFHPSNRENIAVELVEIYVK